MPPAPCTTGSTITAASSSACRSTRSSSSAATYARRAIVKPPAAPARTPAAGSTSRPQLVHAALRVADAHRVERVAVVAAPPGRQPALRRAPAARWYCSAHLHRHLDADRAGVGRGRRARAVRGQLDEGPREPHRRLVGEPAEHHVAHPGQLVGHRRVQRRVAIAVDGRPPRRHAVDQLPPVGQAQPDPVRAHHDIRRRGRRHRRVRMPDARPVDGEDLLGCHRVRASAVGRVGGRARPGGLALPGPRSHDATPGSARRAWTGRPAAATANARSREAAVAGDRVQISPPAVAAPSRAAWRSRGPGPGRGR